MAYSVSGEGSTSKESWNGVALAEAAEKDEVAATAAMLREDGDGASTSLSSSSSSSSVEAESFSKSREDDWQQKDEKLLEELFRLKLTSSAAAAVAPTASLPPKQRIKLYQPRTKLEQFEDILIESQLLEASLPDFEVAALAEAAGLSAADLDLDLINGFDFEASDVIFSDGATSEVKDNDTAKEKALKDFEGGSNSSLSSSPTCDCVSCRERRDNEAKETDQLQRLRKCWLDVREDVWKVYHLVLSNAWNDPNRADEKPDLAVVKDKVHKLVWRDAHQLFLRLETGVREFVLEIKLKLIELLQKQAKNPSLAQDFIQYLLEGYEKLCAAAQYVSPALVDLEVEHLRRFSLTWDVLNKHLYESIIYTDPLIENNLPIFLSQLRSLYPDKEHEARYTEIVRRYLDFDVEMVNIGSFWKNSENLITEYNQQQNMLRTKQRMIKEDWERFKAQRKDLEKQIKSSEKDGTPGEAAISRLGESLNQLLTGLEDVGGSLRIPRDMERDLRHAMDLESPFLSPAMPRRSLMCEMDDGNSADDEVSLEEELSFPFSPEDCNQMAKMFGLGILSKDQPSVDSTEMKRPVDLFGFSGQPASAVCNQDDIFQDIFELDEAELNLPNWLLPKGGVGVTAADTAGPPGLMLSKVDLADEVSSSFKALPSKLTIEDSNEETCCSKQKPDKCECDVCSTPGIPPLDSNLSSNIVPSKSSTSCSADFCQKNDDLSRRNSLPCTVEKFPELLKLYPHLYQTIMEGGETCPRENSNLASIFPSLLTVDGPKGSTSASVAAELSQALSTALSLSDNKDSLTDTLESGKPKVSEAPTPSVEGKAFVGSGDPLSKTTRRSNAEINKLLQQHYCSHKNKKKHPVPSAGAIRKGKVPPPSSCILGDGDSTDELSEDSSSLAQDETSSSASSLGHASNGKQCSCTYCEVFGSNVTSGGQMITPVSRKYPEMRERLRLLLSKKKKEQARCKQQKVATNCSSIASSVSSTTSSIKSATPNGNIAGKVSAEQAAAINDVKMKQAPPSRAPTIAIKGAPAKTAAPSAPIVQPKPAAQPERLTPKPEAARVNQQARSQSASSLLFASSAPPVRKIEKSSSAVAPKTIMTSTSSTTVTSTTKASENDIEALIDFIEGNASNANEKKKAKKERQKQQRLEEIRAKEVEERLRREAEEAERKRKEEEERLRQELERQMLKKQKKKAAQRAKKAAAKGVTIEELDQKPAAVDPVLTLEDLRARQLRELQELQERHQKQLEEERRKFLEMEASKAQQSTSKKSNKKSKNKENNAARASPAPATTNNINSIMSSLSKAGPGTQIKITRTANGGVEFTTIPADGTTTKKSQPQSQPQQQATAMAPNPLQNMMFGQPSMQPYIPQPPQPQPQPPQQQQAVPSKERPSVPSKSNPSQPMVTIRRIESSASSEPTVTISMQNEKDNKLLYTLINGQILKSKDAPEDLIPGAKPLPVDFGYRAPPKPAPAPSNPVMPPAASTGHSSFSPSSSPAARPPLPVDSEGKLDLNRLQLPQGISITRIQGAPPERKYFPAKPDSDQTLLNLPGTLNNPSMQQPVPAMSANNFDHLAAANSALGYSTMSGLPAGLSGPNVIVVDTSSLKTREEERKEAEAKKKKNKKKAKKEESATPPPSSASYPYLSPQTPETSSQNSLKSGPQVLIKNVNGSVVITPIPEPANVTQTTKLKHEGGEKRSGRVSVGENMDEINSIFAPKDIDCDEMDDAEREIEAFKRFCFDSVPLQQKTKVNFDVKNIAFKKK